MKRSSVAPLAGLVLTVAISSTHGPDLGHVISSFMTAAIITAVAAVVVGWVGLQALAELRYHTDQYARAARRRKRAGAQP